MERSFQEDDLYQNKSVFTFQVHALNTSFKMQTLANHTKIGTHLNYKETSTLRISISIQVIHINTHTLVVIKIKFK